MQRMHIECPQNMLFIRGQKDHCGQAFSRQCAEHLKTVHSRHLDIKEYYIWRSLQNAFYRGYPISAFSDDLHILETTQPVNDAAARQGLVVDD
jgi:hypothetical protein